MKNPIIRVASHARAGSHIMAATLTLNFYGPKYNLELNGRKESGHWRNRNNKQFTYLCPKYFGKLGMDHPFWPDALKCAQKLIYIYRDGRDVCLSLWRTKGMRPPECSDMPFDEWLRRPIDWIGGPAYALNRYKAEWRGTRNVVEHWKLHMDSWAKARGDTRVCFVRYEKLMKDPGAVVRGLAKHFDMVPNEGWPHVEKNLIGYSPQEGKVGRWKDYFSSRDLEFFHGIVPEDYWGLCNA